MAVPWPRRLVAGLSAQRPGFVAGSVRVGFMVTKWHRRRFFSEFFGFPGYHSTVASHANISPGGWTIGQLVATVQGYCVTPSTWTTLSHESRKSVGSGWCTNTKVDPTHALYQPTLLSHVWNFSRETSPLPHPRTVPSFPPTRAIVLWVIYGNETSKPDPRHVATRHGTVAWPWLLPQPLLPPVGNEESSSRSATNEERRR
jgi:hypothetical protein